MNTTKETQTYQSGKMDKPLSCPFCGDTATLWHTNDNHHSPYVKCDGAIKTDHTKSCHAYQYPWNFRSDGDAISAWNRRIHTESEPLTVDELHEELGRLEELALATNGDAEETYTNGYRWGHRNGQIELLRRILNIGDGTCESKCRKPERSE